MEVVTDWPSTPLHPTPCGFTSLSYFKGQDVKAQSAGSINQNLIGSQCPWAPKPLQYSMPTHRGSLPMVGLAISQQQYFRICCEDCEFPTYRNKDTFSRCTIYESQFTGRQVRDFKSPWPQTGAPCPTHYTLLGRFLRFLSCVRYIKSTPARRKMPILSVGLLQARYMYY